jgi:hypothetical protein
VTWSIAGPLGWCRLPTVASPSSFDSARGRR